MPDWTERLTAEERGNVYGLGYLLEALADARLEVARLKAERGRFRTQRDQANGRAAGHSKQSHLLQEERDQQREDIRRLVGALEEADHTSLCSDDSTRTPTAKQGRGLCYRCTLLVELSVKYPKGVD